MMIVFRRSIDGVDRRWHSQTKTLRSNWAGSLKELRNCILDALPAVGVMACSLFFHGMIRETAIQLVWWGGSGAWRDGVIVSFFLGVNHEFRLSFTWCMKGVKVKKKGVKVFKSNIFAIYHVKTKVKDFGICKILVF